MITAAVIILVILDHHLCAAQQWTACDGGYPYCGYDGCSTQNWCTNSYSWKATCEANGASYQWCAVREPLHSLKKKIKKHTQNVYSPCGHRFNLLEDVDWKGTIPEIPVRTGIISLRAVRLAISSIVLMHVLQMVMIVLRLSMIVMGIANFGDHFLS